MCDVAASVWDAFPHGEADWVKESDAHRMLVATNGDDQLARRKLREAVLWRHSTLEVWLSAEPPRPPEVRVIAVGKEQRPMVYGCAVHQMTGEGIAEQYACAIDNALDELPSLTYVDLVIDAHGFLASLNMDMLPWFTIAQGLDSYFAERVHSIYVLDMPSMAEFIWMVTKPMLPPKTLAKIHFVASNAEPQMQGLYDLCLDSDMEDMLQALLGMNRRSDHNTGREVSHALTAEFLQMQKEEFADCDS